MTKHIGRQIQVGMGKESSRGTGVAAGYWFPALAVPHMPIAEYADRESIKGTIFAKSGAEVIKQYSAGGIQAEIGSQSFGLILLSMLGGLSSDTKGGESIVYEHTYTLSESAQHQSLTISLDEPNGDTRFVNSMIQNLTMDFTKDKILDFTAGFVGKNEASATNSPSYSTDNIFRPQDFTLYLDSAYGSIGSTEQKVRSLSLTIQPVDVEHDDVLGDLEPQDFMNTAFEISGEMTLIYNAETYKDAHLAGTSKAARIVIENTDVTIGTGSSPKLQIDLAQIKFKEWKRTTDLGAIVMETVSFDAHYSLSDALAIEAVLTNLVSSY